MKAQDDVRSAVIADYELIDDPPVGDLEGLVRLAAAICGVPTAVINVIDARFQHQVAAIGFSASVCSREDSMCAVVFEDPGHVVVPDARFDDRFAANPFVTGVIANVRFYASSPLVTPAGVAIGTLCVFNEETGDLSDEASRALALLASQIVDVLELRRVTRELEHTNNELGHFAGQISHDLRAPLMAVAGFIELAATSPELTDAPNASRALSRADAAVSRMENLIVDILDYARRGASIAPEEVALADLVAVVVEDLDAPLRASDARVAVDAPHRVYADPTLLREVIQNVLANAVKFADASGVDPFLDVQSQDVTEGWRITIDDNGPGVPPDQRERVFGLMERGETRGAAGFGIGLATCRRMIEAHGGRIGIGESPMGGARVWIVLPHAAGA